MGPPAFIFAGKRLRGRVLAARGGGGLDRDARLALLERLTSWVRGAEESGDLSSRARTAVTGPGATNNSAG